MLFKRTSVFLVIILSFFSVFALCSCGNSDDDTSYTLNGVRYETEYKFIEFAYRYPIGRSGFAYDSMITISSNTLLPKTRVKIQASPNYSDNVKMSWKKLRKERQIVRTRVQTLSELLVNAVSDDNMPNGFYRFEIFFYGLQCVKYTYGYVNGEKISETSEIVGEFAPYDYKCYSCRFIGYSPSLPFDDNYDNVVWGECYTQNSILINEPIYDKD